MIEFILSKTLKRLGFSTALNGYEYIFYAILFIIESPSQSYPITRKLYPRIAEKFKVSCTSVEKSIRCSIEAAWLIGDFDFMIEIFQSSVSQQKDRPSNRQFITTIAEYIRLEMLFNSTQAI